MDRKPIIIAPYDAELFGHWWFEGPQWIEFLIRTIANGQKTFKLTTPSEYLSEYPVNEVSLPSDSSWGYKGYGEVWLESSNDWIYRHLHMAGRRMKELAERFSKELLRKDAKRNLIARAINQAARELVLAESSDWPFIMKIGTTVPYAVGRIREHIHNFTRIYEQVMANRIDQEWLVGVEKKNNIFADLDYRSFNKS